jgi:dCMP deaminase
MRPTRDEWLLRVATVTAERATCARRKVGCVLADEKGRILATGYNGPPRGFSHCTVENPCAGAKHPSGTGLELCEAVHAEQNALLQCHDVDDVYSCYVTVSPCVTCVKLLLNTGCQRVVFLEPYAHEEPARILWQSDLNTARAWLQARALQEVSI